MKISYAVAATFLALSSSAAFAQTTTIIEERRAPSVGGVVGGVVDTAISVPGAVIDFVTGQRPTRSVRVERQIVVGEPLPETVEIVAIPEHREYSYAYVNDRRVIVEPRTRRVVRVLD